MIVYYLLGCFFVMLVILMLYILKPNCKRIKELPEQLFAHRGLHGKEIPENSLSAFKKAYEKNLGVELDVRFTLDKKLVVFHDDTLQRLCGEDINVNDLTYENLQKYSLNETNEKIPLFSEVLKVLNGMPVICEIKSNHKEPTDELCQIVYREIKDYTGFICIESFDPFVVKWFRKNRPDVIRGQLSMNFVRDNKTNLTFIEAFIMTHLFVNVLSRPDFVAYRYKDVSFGYFLCRKVYNVLCVPWTVKGEKEIKEARKVFKSIIFEEN